MEELEGRDRNDFEEEELRQVKIQAVGEDEVEIQTVNAGVDKVDFEGEEAHVFVPSQCRG